MIKVCFIDDDAFLREMTEEMLILENIEVNGCGRETQLLTLYAIHAYDALIIDINLGDTSDGIHFASLCRQFGIDIPIVFFSSEVTEYNINRAQKIKNSIILDKSISFHELSEKIKKFIDKQGTLL